MTLLASRPPVDTTERGDLLRLARECSDYIVARNPYVKLVAVSGSLCRPEHEGAHEDIDYFVVARRGHIWQAFLGCLYYGWRFARARGMDRRFFCFNYLVDEAHPEEIDLRRREYAQEFLNLCVIHGADEYRRLLNVHADRLRQAVPERFEEVLRTTDDASNDGPVFAASKALPYALTPGFRLFAKRMEARRRALYPGGYVYSNNRVIRSHFRRSWHNDPAEEDGLPVSRAFDAIAGSYAADVETTPANEHMRSIVHDELRQLVKPGMSILDLGAGTGTDAVWLARLGATVLAIDVSQGMVDEARRRVEAEGLERVVEVRRLAIENLSSLLPEYARRFDLVLCDFGALNTAGAATAWGPVAARLLKPDGRLVATVMNRWCLPEMAASLLRLRPSFALRRWRAQPIAVGGVPLTTRLYSPGEFAGLLRGSFEQDGIRGLCVTFPPPTLEFSAGALVRSRLLRTADRFVGRVPLLRGLGDHFLAVMKPRTGGYTLFEAGAPITASPVVDDLNGDGEAEVVVAADRLWVLDRGGRPLYGWPRRASKPIASTPLVVRDGDSTRIYAGSDDHRLYGFDFTGRKLSNYPFATGGDVFSSPWTGDLDGDGREAVAFGSDDGRIYALDEAGRPRTGWPVPTEGYVSASASAARWRDGRALFIGSWDGKLYGLDGQGRPIPGWPRRIGFPIWGTAAVADIDGDGFADVVVAAHRLFTMRGNGDAMPGFPVSLGGYVAGSPAIGDIDGDGRPEIVVASDRVYAFSADGRPVEGFPVDIGAYVWSSPLLVDVDGDGRAEVVVADMSGRVWAIDGQGKVLDGWPRKAGRRIAATPVAADLDGDGYLELLVATWE
ncbi:MAG TPA: FG-GAP-like repeat-containing protein, partial [Dehalococcoidia bacterium]|nr:FG-GAP-like repeat-containing protein [Dehalococcoidia bacterium]